MIKLQERVRRLESLIKNQSQGINSARSEALDSGSADDSEVSEDEHVFNRLQVGSEGMLSPVVRQLIRSSTGKQANTDITAPLRS